MHIVHDRAAVSTLDHGFDSERERLVHRHLPLVRSLARRHGGRGESLEDLVQVGSLALVAAAARFDPTRGVPFAAYAIRSVDGELRNHIRDRVGPVRVPRRQRRTAAHVLDVSRDVSQRIGRQASIAETAAAAGMAVREVQEALAVAQVPASLTELETVASAAADEAIEACELRAHIDDCLRRLDAREREIVMLRFDADLGQVEIGRRMHMSQSQASRVLAAALEKLKDALASEWDRAA
jgi:RNA polymerase sigma-B factor